MIKTIILDEAKVYEFLKRLGEQENQMHIINHVPKGAFENFAKEKIEQFLETTKIKTQ